MGRFRELDVGAPIPQPVDAQLRESNEVLLGLALCNVDGQDRVPDLLDRDGGAYGGKKSALSSFRFVRN